ncbi:hypothetical protein RJ640_017923 [Escallonia rubra]|uniref:Uncharacterized protein n=1 Tax=Escallonia rubra TaxID=112253 RepID=A0AA88QIY3_9ASTE|nr:hypothetical protein RJ640_017923 [Escallonia rubra]
MNMVMGPEFASVDHDEFYAELERQILVLTAEDDSDDFVDCSKVSNSMRAVKHGSSMCVIQPGSYFDWTEDGNTNSVPTWLLNLWRNGNGTGVFIPHIVNSRRRNKPKKRNNEKGRTYRPVASKKG